MFPNLFSQGDASHDNYAHARETQVMFFLVVTKFKNDNLTIFPRMVLPRCSLNYLKTFQESKYDCMHFMCSRMCYLIVILCFTDLEIAHNRTIEHY